MERYDNYALAKTGEQIPSKGPSLWETIANAFKGGGEAKSAPFKDDTNVAGFMEGFKNLGKQNEEPPEQAMAIDDAVYGGPRLSSLLNDEEASQPVPKFQTKEYDNQAKMLRESIKKLEDRPNDIDFSPLAAYFGMNPAAFKPDMSRSEKEKMVLGLKEKVSELEMRKQEIKDKQEYYLERERIRQKERAEDRKIRLMALQERFGAKAATAAKRTMKDEETLATSMRSQNKDALQYLASMKHNMEDEDLEDPNVKARVKAYRDVQHRNITETARTLMRQDPTLKFNDAYRMVLEEEIKMEEESNSQEQAAGNS